MGNDSVITLGGMSGNFELNVIMPLIAHNLLQSIKCLGAAVKMFDEKCVKGLEANKQKIAETIEKILVLATSLAPIVGYDKAAEISKKAFAANKTVREMALSIPELKLSHAELDKILDPSLMVIPGAGGGGE